MQNQLPFMRSNMQIVGEDAVDSQLKDEYANPLEFLDDPEQFDEQEGAFITIKEPFEASDNHRQRGIHNFHDIDLVPQTKTHSENTNDKIQKAVSELIGFQHPSQKNLEVSSGRDQLLQLLQNGRAAKRDSVLGQIQGRAAFQDKFRKNKGHKGSRISLSEVKDSSKRSEL